MRKKGCIFPTVGLWGVPSNKFRVFKAAGMWHVVWPNEMFAKLRTPFYEEARLTVVAEMRKHS